MFLEANRRYTLADHAVAHFDHALRTLLGKPLVTERQYPAADIDEPSLTSEEKSEIAGLMRVNHSGEVAAQGLYQGQALTAKNSAVKVAMEHSAREENDHLAWCQRRLAELQGRRSYLDPVWFTGSLLIGMIAGLAGDQWSLGFVEETEQQVTAHLSGHEERLPKHDLKTTKIIQQMKLDEATHADSANSAGAEALPFFIKKIMQFTAKIMTSAAYYI